MKRIIMVMGIDIDEEEVKEVSIKFKGLDELDEDETGTLVSFIEEAMIERILPELE